MSDKKDCGALWLNTAKSGTKYMSGVVEIDGVKHKIVVFKNNYKKDEKQPDYRIFPSEPREGVASEAPIHAEKFEDDVPF